MGLKSLSNAVESLSIIQRMLVPKKSTTVLDSKIDHFLLLLRRADVLFLRFTVFVFLSLIAVAKSTPLQHEPSHVQLSFSSYSGACTSGVFRGSLWERVTYKASTSLFGIHDDDDQI